MRIKALAVLWISVSLATAAFTQEEVPPPATLRPRLVFAFPCSGFTCSDGYFPVELIEASDGNFYGSAAGGGEGMNAQGTIFQITPAGEISVIYSFAEEPDGSLPNGSAPGTLVEGIDGFLYGITSENGANGVGTLFKLSKSGTIQVLHNFCNTLTCSDGANPGFLMQAIDGNFYGATGPTNYPTSVLFRITPSGAYTVLHTFDSRHQPDGTGAYGMVQAPDGNLYGTTVAGEQLKPFNSLFRFEPEKGLYKIIYGFDTPNINLPGVATSAPALTSSGELFGLQAFSDLYKIGARGDYEEIGSLSSKQFFDGGIFQASDGNLWGNFVGGDCGSGEGIVFSADPSGSLLESVTFNCKTVGEQLAAMLQAADGSFYGVTLGNGGVNSNPIDNGTVWKLDAGVPVPDPSIIAFRPTSGNVGARVLLQGNHFVGTTAVTVSGVDAKFKVLSVNYLRLIVPSGAKTGPITVTNAGGTVTSSKKFTVN
jgi:uncharacterized repeat protein (TIGR03803 family)